jgi:serine/threonine protein kinase
MTSGLQALLDVNPNMKLKSMYKSEMPGQSMTSVYLVDDAGQDVVVKMAPKDNDKCSVDARNQVLRENQVLQELNGFHDTPKYLGFMDLGDYVALARENLEFQWMDVWKGKGAEKYQALKQLIEAYHDRGVAGLDIDNPRNIAILNHDKNQFTLFDFGFSVLRNQDPRVFEREVERDYEALDRIYKR